MKLTKLFSLAVFALFMSGIVHAQTSYILYLFQSDNAYKKDCTSALIQYSNSDPTWTGDYGTAELCFTPKTGNPLQLSVPHNPVTGGSMLVDCTNSVVTSSGLWELSGDACENSNGDYVTGAIYTSSTGCASGDKILASGYEFSLTLCNGREVDGTEYFSVVVPAYSKSLIPGTPPSNIFRTRAKDTPAPTSN